MRSLTPAKPGDRSSGPSSVILIVEDDPETRRFYQAVFEPHGFRVEQAHNGLQALEKAFAALPDLIVTDIAVPGIDGIELCRRLGADDRTKSIPVLAITGHGDRQYPDRAVNAGASQVLFKPCTADVLVAHARRLLEASAESRDLVS